MIDVMKIREELLECVGPDKEAQNRLLDWFKENFRHIRSSEIVSERDLKRTDNPSLLIEHKHRRAHQRCLAALEQYLTDTVEQDYFGAHMITSEILILARRK